MPGGEGAAAGLLSSISPMLRSGYANTGVARQGAPGQTVAPLT
jgi:hypothetical protein